MEKQKLEDSQEVLSTCLELNDENYLKYKDYDGIENIQKEKVCPICGKIVYAKFLPLVLVGRKMITYYEAPKCECEEKLEKEQLKQKQNELKQREFEKISEKRKQYIELLRSSSGIEKRFSTRTFETFKKTTENEKYFAIAKKYVDNFLEFYDKGQGLIITGTCGSGKTYLSCCIANELLKQGHSVKFGNSVSLLDSLRKTYHTEENEYQVLSKLINADLLIIDDLGKEKPSEWTLEKLYYIINERYEKMKPIVFTTNYNEKELIERLSIKDNKVTAEAIVSRINEMCNGLNLTTKDQRR